MKLIKGMSQDEVNALLLFGGYDIKLDDKQYLGNNQLHTWICSCGNLIHNKAFSKLMRQKSILCAQCRYKQSEERYKHIVEQIPGYTYIRSYRSGDIVKFENRCIQVKDNPYLEVQHIPCGRIYKKTVPQFKKNIPCICGNSYHNLNEAPSQHSNKVRLRMGMSQKEVNLILSSTRYNIQLNDKQYLGNNEPHTWICSCGNLIPNKIFSKIMSQNSILCAECRYKQTEEKYKNTVEQIDGYVYIRSYRSGDTIRTSNKIINVKDSPYMVVKHQSCGRTYLTTFGGFKQGKRCTCAPCEKSIKFKYPEISKLIYSDCNNILVDEKIKSTIYAKSSEKFHFKCDKCGKVSDKCITLSQVVGSGYSCKYCSDGISLPEKFFISLLDSIKVSFKFQRLFRWSNNKRYDFYIPSHKLIIEVHGIQHYEESPLTNRTLQEEQENDLIKHKLAVENGCRYLVIDCRKSTFDWLKNQCIQSLPNNLLDLSKVNWTSIWEASQKSYVIEVWKLWDSGKSISDIVKILKLCTTTVRRYLKAGEASDKCTYNSQEEKEKIKRKVICITTQEIYDSINAAAKENNLTLKSLHRCCNSKYKRLGTTTSGEKLIWMYYDSFLKCSSKDIEILKNLEQPQKRTIVCTTTGKEFHSTQEAADYYGIQRRNISSCCHGKRNYCGKLDDGTPLRWAFKTE